MIMIMIMIIIIIIIILTIIITTTINDDDDDNNNNNQIRLDLVKHLMIKISETSFTQRFDDSMSSFSSEKDIYRAR